MSDTSVEEAKTELADEARASGLIEKAKTMLSSKGRFIEKYVRERDNIAAENEILKITALLVLVAVLVLAFSVSSQSAKTRIVVVPFSKSEGDLLLVGDQPSHEYLSAIARDIVGLAGTFTASSAEYQFNELLKFVHPSVYAATREEWKELVEQLREYREVSFATYYLPQKPIEIFGDKILVHSKRSRVIGETINSETGFVEIKYVIENSRFWILDVEFKVMGANRAKK